MTNHVHLFVTPHAAESCALLMKNLGQRYVQAVNKRRGRSGTLWEGRFYSCLVPTERYALACYRYVERNPIKPAFYVPYSLKMRMFTQLLVRTRVPPLSMLLASCFKAGFVLDGMEEPASPRGSSAKNPFAWAKRPDIPPAIVLRLRRN